MQITSMLPQEITFSSATINADNFNVTAGGNFFNQDNTTISANNFNVTTGQLLQL